MVQKFHGQENHGRKKEKLNITKDALHETDVKEQYTCSYFQRE